MGSFLRFKKFAKKFKKVQRKRSPRNVVSGKFEFFVSWSINEVRN